jgi:hypothetical protein
MGQDSWFDPIEAGIRERIRGFIGELLDQEMTAALGRARHERASEGPTGYRHGAVRELLPALVQACREVARRGEGGSGITRRPRPIMITGTGVHDRTDSALEPK